MLGGGHFKLSQTFNLAYLSCIFVFLLLQLFVTLLENGI
jgi:hypothetical protein